MHKFIKQNIFNLENFCEKVKIVLSLFDYRMLIQLIPNFWEKTFISMLK